MSDLTNVEKQLLCDLNDRATYDGDEYLFDFNNYMLKETDPVKQIQEIVFYLERLEGFGFITTEKDFYTESDKLSFEYMNSATEIDFSKVRITVLGQSWVEENGTSFYTKISRQLNDLIESFFTNKYYTILGYIITFLLGLIIGKMVL